MYLDQSKVLEYRPHMELVFLFQTLMDALSSLHDKDKFHNCCRQFFLNSKLHHHSCKVQYWVHRYILNLCHFSSNSKMDIPLHILFDIWFMHYGKSLVINRSWCISTTPNTTKICLIILKLIQQSIIEILSCPVKKNPKLEFEGTKFSLLLKVEFSRQKRLQTFLISNKLNFFPRIQILIFLHEATQNDHNRLLYKFENDQKNVGCVVSFC